MRKTLFLLICLCFTVLSSMAQPIAGKTYLILSVKYSGMYISEEADGTMVVSSKDNTKRMFWIFETADAAAGTFYIKNAVSGNYMQSCNKTPSSSSIMKTGSTPIAYYVGKSASGEFTGKYWLSSTDCDNYNDNSKTPRGLNKDGASSNVIVWNAGLTNGGSYWDLEETEDVYEIKPFVVSPDKEHLTIPYHIVSPNGQYLSHSGNWEAPSDDQSFDWYFVGSSNKTGYQIVNSKNKNVLSQGDNTVFCVAKTSIEGDDNAYYKFTALNDPSEVLTIDGVSAFTFKKSRTQFERNHKIYHYPCGEKTGQYFNKVQVTGEGASRFLIYPLRYKTATSTASQTVAPTSWFTLSVMDKPVFKAGKTIDLDMTLQKTPSAAERAFVYFDWNLDGVFEDAYELEISKNMKKSIAVPTTACVGKSRMRLRVTNNNLAGADDDVAGQTLDFAIEVIKNTSDSFHLTVDVNDTLRGKVEYNETNVNAIPYNSSSFVCWKEGVRVVSVRANYAYTLDHDLHLTAYFAADKDDPFGDSVVAGIKEKQLSDQNVLVNLEVNKNEIEVVSSEPVSKMYLYNVNGALVKAVEGNKINTKSLMPTTYILKVFTKKQDKTLKVLVK